MNTNNKLNKFTITITSMGIFEKSQRREFLEWLLSIKFSTLTLKAENNSLILTTNDYTLIEAILTLSPFESYAFKITEIVDEELFKIVEKWK